LGCFFIAQEKQMAKPTPNKKPPMTNDRTSRSDAVKKKFKEDEAKQQRKKGY